MNSKTLLAVCAQASIALLVLVESASASAIDLNDFTKDPTVTVAVDGSSAVMAEDSTLSPVLLANDPGLGDPNIISPASGLALMFDYVFVEPAPDNLDEFGAFVVDSATGGSAGNAYEFFIQAAGSGTVSFDLSGLVGSTIGLQFQLSALPGDAALTSTVTISNVRLEPLAVPEPGSGWLILGGLCGLGLVRVYRTQAKQSSSSLCMASLS